MGVKGDVAVRNFRDIVGVDGDRGLDEHPAVGVEAGGGLDPLRVGHHIGLRAMHQVGRQGLVVPGQLLRRLVQAAIGHRGFEQFLVGAREVAKEVTEVGVRGFAVGQGDGRAGDDGFAIGDPFVDVGVIDVHLVVLQWG